MIYFASNQIVKELRRRTSDPHWKTNMKDSLAAGLESRFGRVRLTPGYRLLLTARTCDIASRKTLGDLKELLRSSELLVFRKAACFFQAVLLAACPTLTGDPRIRTAPPYFVLPLINVPKLGGLCKGCVKIFVDKL